MIAFIGVLSFVAFMVLAIMAIIAAIKKNGKAKKYLLFSGCSLALMIILIAVDPGTTEDKETTASNEVVETTSPEPTKEAEQPAESPEETATPTPTPEPTPTPKPKPTPKPEPKNDPGISKAEFNQIKNGMTYEEVSKIIGSEGEVLSEVGTEGEDYYTIMYMWEGETGIGANANFTFQGGKLEMKAQFLLE